MAMELNLHFPTPEEVIVRWEREESERLPFTVPLSDQERQNLAWYIEGYSSSYAADI